MLEFDKQYMQLAVLYAHKGLPLIFYILLKLSFMRYIWIILASINGKQNWYWS